MVHTNTDLSLYSQTIAKHKYHWNNIIWLADPNQQSPYFQLSSAALAMCFIMIASVCCYSKQFSQKDSITSWLTTVTSYNTRQRTYMPSYAIKRSTGLPGLWHNESHDQSIIICTRWQFPCTCFHGKSSSAWYPLSCRKKSVSLALISYMSIETVFIQLIYSAQMDHCFPSS